ncbi:hypothetical protein MMC07_006449 [Pseudocyphellaria aurata]|nr:hypothetical protein [Pseudocyphellaria aurata]
MSAQQFLQITPPQSFTSPPTPPATEQRTRTPTSISQILAAVKGRRDGYRLPTDENWRRFSLDIYDYRDLQRRLRKAGLWGYYADKVRHDYFPSAELFVLRMPSAVHEILAIDITQEILGQLRAIAQSGGPSAIFAGKIKTIASTTLEFGDPEFGPHDPDTSLAHFEADYPSVILEVSYPQKRKDLSRLADEYILGSDANIRVVIGIDVEYKGTKKASVSIWRPHVGLNDVGEKELSALQTVTDQFFRNDERNLIPNPQASLQLRLEDFGTEALGAKLTDLTQSVHISAETLFNLLEGAEVMARRLQRGKRRQIMSNTPWVRKRGRESTPPEELDPDWEAIFAEQEHRAAKKAMMDDGSYKASSSEAGSG